MKRFILFVFLLASVSGFSQKRKYSAFYDQRNSLFEVLPTSPKDVIFLGNSITNGGEWTELFGNKNMKNRGISADTSEGVLDRLAPIVKGKPKKIFLLIGTNDIARKNPLNSVSTQTIDSIAQNIEKIVLEVKKASPKTKFYLQSILPVNADFKMFNEHQQPEAIKLLNQKIKQISEKHNVRYVDLYTHFVVENTDKLNPDYTNDGLHLTGEGYLLWARLIKPYLK
ncbi:MAG: GDSL-type esterase/lipase family protein [Capnocytophaga sp.]|nr:GDSL-type esterase/lipase family protein [Capnocytophaga sp.]